MDCGDMNIWGCRRGDPVQATEQSSAAQANRRYKEDAYLVVEEYAPDASQLLGC